MFSNAHSHMTRRFIVLFLFLSTFVARRGAFAETLTLNEYFQDLPRSVADEVTRALAKLDMLTIDGQLTSDVSTQSFFDREADISENDEKLEIDSSALFVKWPTAANEHKISFVLYTPTEQGTLHAMHICGFLRPDLCENEVPYPGRSAGRCGESDAENQRAGYFCDFVSLRETDETNGGVLMYGTEKLERYEAFVEGETNETLVSSIELHFDLVALGDIGVDIDEVATAPSSAPSPTPSADKDFGETPRSKRRMLPVRGPAFAGLHMTMRSGPGRRSFVTLPGSL